MARTSATAWSASRPAFADQVGGQHRAGASLPGQAMDGCRAVLAARRVVEEGQGRRASALVVGAWKSSTGRCRPSMPCRSSAPPWQRGLGEREKCADSMVAQSCPDRDRRCPPPRARAGTTGQHVLDEPVEPMHADDSPSSPVRRRPLTSMKSWQGTLYTTLSVWRVARRRLRPGYRTGSPEKESCTHGQGKRAKSA